MPSASYHITEPHPTVSKSNRYLFAGRGGAGNYSSVDPSSLTAGADASGPASRTTLKSTGTPYYSGGRGGAGNMSLAGSGTERPMFSFDEELERQRRMEQHQAPLYHVGRGGAGNWSSESAAKARTGSMSSSESVSSGQAKKNIEAMFGRIRGSFGSATSK